jgi:hypothetical protein
VSTDAPWRTGRREALGADGTGKWNGRKGGRNDRRRRLEGGRRGHEHGRRCLEAVRRIRELRTRARSELRVDEDELWSQLFHHNE